MLVLWSHTYYWYILVHSDSIVEDDAFEGWHLVDSCDHLSLVTACAIVQQRDPNGKEHVRNVTRETFHVTKPPWCPKCVKWVRFGLRRRLPFCSDPNLQTLEVLKEEPREFLVVINDVQPDQTGACQDTDEFRIYDSASIVAKILKLSSNGTELVEHPFTPDEMENGMSTLCQMQKILQLLRVIHGLEFCMLDCRVYWNGKLVDHPDTLKPSDVMRETRTVG